MDILLSTWNMITGASGSAPIPHIPNTQGYRNDVLEALKTADSGLRWPGGCFADEYHWRRDRPAAVETKNDHALRGGTVEDNSFGTHEFLNLCELLGCEPRGRKPGSGTVGGSRLGGI